MIRSLLLCLVISLAENSPLLATEHAACNKVGYDWSHLTAGELRSIAANCQSNGYSNLNYHRANYLDLIVENKRISSLVYPTRSGTEANISARLFHMVLVEQLTPYYMYSEMQQLAFLNEEYHINNEIAGKWLRGYADMTKRLDRLQTQRNYSHR